MRAVTVLTLALLASKTLAAPPAVQCQQLLMQAVPETEIQQVVFEVDRVDLPPFCEVRGEVAQRIKFVMRLPVEDWNSKFVVTGCGGFCGYLRPDKPGYANSMNAALTLGYAVIQTDSGHQAPNWSTDWAIDDDAALQLFAGQWLPLATATGQALVLSFYQSPTQRTYFQGCSNGGRLGLYAAQRYPQLFDGIAAGGAIFDLTGNAGVHGLWLLQTTRDKSGKAIISRDKMGLLSEHVMTRCDKLDGVEDGVVSVPSLCDPGVGSLQCPPDETGNCLTMTEVAAVERLYRGAHINGQQLFPGVPPGSEDRWAIWLVGTDSEWAWGERAAEGMLRLTYGIAQDEPFNAHDYVLADELTNLQRYAAEVNATNPDLSGLEKAGGKLFYYHGLADPLILPGRAQQYHTDAVVKMGSERLDKVMRFVMIPGHGHCWEKPGPAADAFNPLSVIDRWVESGVAPNEVITQRPGVDEQAYQGKLCALPSSALYQGGAPGDARSYRCE